MLQLNNKEGLVRRTYVCPESELIEVMEENIILYGTTEKWDEEDLFDDEN